MRIKVVKFLSLLVIASAVSVAVATASSSAHPKGPTATKRAASERRLIGREDLASEFSAYSVFLEPAVDATSELPPAVAGGMTAAGEGIVTAEARLVRNSDAQLQTWVMPANAGQICTYTDGAELGAGGLGGCFAATSSVTGALNYGAATPMGPIYAYGIAPDSVHTVTITSKSGSQIVATVTSNVFMVAIPSPPATVKYNN